VSFNFAREIFLESNHLDESTKFSLRGSGAFVLASCMLVPLFTSKANMESKATVRHLSYLFVAHAMCFAYQAQDANPQLANPFFLAMALVKAALAFLFLWVSPNHVLSQAPKSKKPRLTKELFYPPFVVHALP